MIDEEQFMVRPICALAILALLFAALPGCESSKTEPVVNTKAGQRLMKPANTP